MKNTENKDGYTKHYPQGNNKFSRDEVMKAMIISFGVMTGVARQLKISPNTVYKYLDEYDLFQFRDQCRDNIEDLAYESVMDGLDDPKIGLGLLGHIRQSKQASERLKINVDTDGGVNIEVTSKEDADTLNSFLND